MKIPFALKNSIILLLLVIFSFSCSKSGDVSPSSSTVTPPTTPLATDMMVNGYFPSYHPTSFFSSFDYTNLTIAYFSAVVCDQSGNVITFGTESKMAAMITAAHASNCKAYLSFGGGGYYGSSTFYNMAANDSSRMAFAHNVKVLCQTQGFDGFDVDWEGLADNNQGLAHQALMTTLKDTLHNAGLGLAVTVQEGNSAAYFTRTGIDQADLVQIMAYDATGTWSGSPVGQPSDYSYAISGISYWSQVGIAKSKLVLGLPFYGYNFTTMPCPCPAVSYASIVSAYPGLDDDLDFLSTGPYSNTYFNGFTTIDAKVSLAHSKGTAGVMIWEMSMDASGASSLLTRMVASLNAQALPVRKLAHSIP